MKIVLSKEIFISALLLLTALIAACQPIQPVTDDGNMAESSEMEESGSDSVVHMTILHLNDIYEILPVGGGTMGGLARITTLRNQLAEANPNTIAVFAGDLYTPSAMSSAIVDGTPLDGEQSVAVMNTVGIDYMTFGDHEFHVSSEDEFYQRLSETNFPIVSGNLLDGNGEAFPGVLTNDILTISNEAGQEAKIGIMAITEQLGETVVEHTYIDPMEAAEAQIAELRDEVDVLIALTHFHFPEDEETARAFPEIDLILGGDDHENMAVETGEDSATIYKSDSNARNVYVLDLYYDTATSELTIEANVQAVTDDIEADPETQAVVDEWTAIAFDAFRAEGIAPDELVAQAPFDLDGLATSIRNYATDFTDLVIDSMLDATTDTEISFFYTGNIRLDDLIPAGSDFIQFDLIRAFPTNYDVVAIESSGQYLIDNFDYGASVIGSGGYILSSNNITAGDDGEWLLDGEPIDPEGTYISAVFNNLVTEDVTVLEEVGSIRDVLAAKLQAISE